MLLPIAATLLKDSGVRAGRRYAAALADCLFDMGRFDDAVDWYRTAFQGAAPDSTGGVQALVGGAVRRRQRGPS